MTSRAIKTEPEEDMNYTEHANSSIQPLKQHLNDHRSMEQEIAVDVFHRIKAEPPDEIGSTMGTYEHKDDQPLTNESGQINSNQIDNFDVSYMEEVPVKLESVPVDSPYGIEQDHLSTSVDDMIEISEVKIEPDRDDNEEIPSLKSEDPPASPSDEKFKCDTCSREFPNRTKLGLHMKTHGPKEYPCTLCGKLFALQWYATKHLVSCERKRKKVAIKHYKCDICEKAFRKSCNLSTHKVQMHGPKIHECHICGSKYGLQRTLEKHIGYHIRNGESKEDFRAIEQKLQKDNFTNRTDGVEEKKVNGESTEDSNQSSHIEEEQQVTCKECNKVCHDRRAMLLHYKLKHHKKFKCSMCDAAFGTEKYLDYHVSAVHTAKDDDSRILYCATCNKNYPTSAQFRAHMRGHQPKDQTCTVCNKLFNRDQITRHMKTHEQRDDQLLQLLKCESCEKYFPNKLKLRNHMRIHKPRTVSCTVCDKLFHKMHQMERHRKIHQKESLQQNSMIDIATEFSEDQSLVKIEPKEEYL